MKDNLKKFESDKEVARMLKFWDVVRCKVCGKKISMLTAKPTRDGSGFMCKGH